VVIAAGEPWRFRAFLMNRRAAAFPALGDVTLENLALLVDGSPEVNHLPVQPHVHFIQVPTPVAEAPHAADPLPADVGREHGPKSIPPEPHGLMADVDATLKQ
jgi:hypothetical protein